MATQFADRAFLSMNGAKIADLQSASLKQEFNANVVKSMTPDKFNRGFVEGNTDISIDMELAVQNGLATPKMETINFGTNDIQLTFVVGADQYVATGIFRKSVEIGASGIGTEAKKKFSFGALKCTDAVGNSVLFDLKLG